MSPTSLSMFQIPILLRTSTTLRTRFIQAVDGSLSINDKYLFFVGSSSVFPQHFSERNGLVCQLNESLLFLFLFVHPRLTQELASPNLTRKHSINISRLHHIERQARVLV